MDLSAGLLVADLVGVAVFAASGGSAAVAKRLDVFGVVSSASSPPSAGGVLRDLVIDEVPPLAFADWRYSATAIVAALLVFWFHPQLARLRRVVLLLDAAGLGCSPRPARSRPSTTACRPSGWWRFSGSGPRQPPARTPNP